MSFFTPISKTSFNVHTLNNVHQTGKIFYRLKAHGIFFIHCLQNGCSLKKLLIARFPFVFSDAEYPPSMHVELTNSCNLNCVYCNNPHFHDRGTMMSQVVFDALLKNLQESGIDRLCLGGGEPTIHPRFVQMLSKIRKNVRILTIVTNAQWKNKEIAEALIINNVDLIEVSVDAGGREQYETSRKGASYDTLLHNLTLLKTLKKQCKSASQINIRLMIRPSNLINQKSEMIRFASYCDTIMPQYIMKLEDTPYDEDVFQSKHKISQEYPRCTYPFKNLQIRATGDVYICQVSGSALNSARKVKLGNIKQTGISELWNCEIMKRYRHAHRKRINEDIPICKGCRGC